MVPNRPLGVRLHRLEVVGASAPRAYSAQSNALTINAYSKSRYCVEIRTHAGAQIPDDPLISILHPLVFSKFRNLIESIEG